MKNLIKSMFVILGLNIATVALCHGQTSDNLSQQEAKEAAFDCAVANCFGHGSEDYDFFMSKSVVNAPASYKGSPFSECWLVFVDMKPDANWEHPCKYIYVGIDKAGYSVCAIDSCLPPSDIELDAVSLSGNTVARTKTVSLRDDTNANIRQTFVTPFKVSDNNFSSNTYALILSGGSSPALNASRYWNDCSFIYKTLTQTYGVPKSNIKVLMSDGKSSAADKNTGFTFSPILENSSADLDGDGKMEVDYSATKDTLSMVLSDFKAKLTDKDHLLVFVTDHGGRDNNNGQAYINLWNSQRIYPSEFAGFFNGFNVGYISFVLGQCYSGGFIPALKADNHIVMTACGENEESFRCVSADKDYNEFLYNWTSAVNGSDTFGNKVALDTDNKQVGSIDKRAFVDAFEYAVEKDAYNKGNTLRSVENPQISVFRNSTAEQLALDTIPPTVDLCITDYVRKSADSKNFLWASPYIWIRNQNDGRQNQKTENPVVTEDHPYVYIYAKVSNRGVKPYMGTGQHVGYCWAKSSLVITADMWKGLMNKEHSTTDITYIYGNTIGTKRISDTITPGDTVVTEKKHYFLDDEFDEVDSKNFGMCVLAYLTNAINGCDFDRTESGYADLQRSHKLVQNNTVSNVKRDLEDFRCQVMFPNVCKEARSYSIGLQSNSSSSRLLSKAEVCIDLPSSFVLGLSGDVENSDSIKMDVNDKGMVHLLGNESLIRNVKLSAQEAKPISLVCNFLADQAIDEAESYDLDFFVTDNATGEKIGGQRFHIEGKARPAIEATVEKKIAAVGTETLSVESCSEAAQCEWFDKNGKLVGTGTSVTVPSTSNQSEYTVRIKANSDGAIIYRKINVGGIPAIDTVNPWPGRVDVVLKNVSDGSLSLQLSSAASSAPVQTCSVATGSKFCTMQVRNFTQGIYNISLLKDGKVIDSIKFAK